MNFLQGNFPILLYFFLSKSQTVPGNKTSSTESDEHGRFPLACTGNIEQDSKRLVLLKFPHKVLPNSYAFIIKRNQIITLASYLSLENVHMISAACIRLKSKVANLYSHRRIAHPQYANTRRNYDIAIIIVDNTTGFDENFPIATEYDSVRGINCFLLNEDASYPVTLTAEYNPDAKSTYIINDFNQSGVVLCCGKLLGFTLHESASSTHRRIQTFTKLHDFIKAPEFYAPYIDGLTSKGEIAIFSVGNIGFVLLFNFIFN